MTHAIVYIACAAAAAVSALNGDGWIGIPAAALIACVYGVAVWRRARRK